MSETLEEKFSRNTAWSEEFKRGYNNGHASATSHWKTVLKNELAAKDRERVNLLRVYPYNLIHAKETAWLVKKYGKLDDSWPQMLHDGFAEGMRVLAPNGTLVFKWSEHDIPADKVWKAIGRKPLFGIHSGKRMQTFFGVFMKFKEDNDNADN